MTEHPSSEPSPSVQQFALPVDEELASGTLLNSPEQAHLATDLAQERQPSSLATRRVSTARAALVILFFFALALIGVGSWTLLRNTRSGVMAKPQQTPHAEVTRTAQVISTSRSELIPTPLDIPIPTLGASISLRATTAAAPVAADPQPVGEAGALADQVAYARDVLTGTVYLNTSNVTRWQLADRHGHSLSYPIDMTLSDGGLYVIDSGSLYRAELAALPVGGGVLTMTAVLTPTASISGYPVKEIMALDGAAYDDALFVLDKSNDIYRYQPSSGRWSLELPLAKEYRNPDPFYNNLSTYANRLYMLDPARNQIWRHSDSFVEPQYLSSQLPWLLQPGAPDVSSGLDLAIDGNIYVLARDGSIDAFNPAPWASYSLEPATERSSVAGLEQTRPQPVAIEASGDGVTLYVADPGQRRVVALNRQDGRTLRQFLAPDNLDFAFLHAIAEDGDQLLMLAGSRLYAIDLSDGITASVPLTGQLPLWAPLPELDRSQLRPADTAPNDPRLPSIIASYGFTMPLQSALLPDRSAIYPGSRRAYRYGVHEGMDIYGGDVGVTLAVGTPVLAAADGVIMRADVGYQELSPQELNALLDDANARHDTPRASLDKLGGRQIWIDHGDGLATTYLHLDSIAEGVQVGQPVKAGQVIGTVGVSGTPDGAAGITQFAHLHFEIRTGNELQYYLGQWLSIEETRRAFEEIFPVPVRPAYLDFRQ